MRTKRKTWQLPPPNNKTQLNDNCRNNNCVKGWIDHFEEGSIPKPLPDKWLKIMMKQSGLSKEKLLEGFEDKKTAEYVTTTPCPTCRPMTYDYLQLFPNVGERTVDVLHAMQAKREQLKVVRGKHNV
jgi:hypothetical protein